MDKNLIDCYLVQQKNKLVRVTLPHQFYSTYISFIDDYTPELRDCFVYGDELPEKEDTYLLIYVGKHDFGRGKYVAVCQDLLTKQAYVFATDCLSFVDDTSYSIPKINKKYGTPSGPLPPILVMRSRDKRAERDRWMAE